MKRECQFEECVKKQRYLNFWEPYHKECAENHLDNHIRVVQNKWGDYLSNNPEEIDNIDESKLEETLELCQGTLDSHNESNKAMKDIAHIMVSQLGIIFIAFLTAVITAFSKVEILEGVKTIPSFNIFLMGFILLVFFIFTILSLTYGVAVLAPKPFNRNKTRTAVFLDLDYWQNKNNSSKIIKITKMLEFPSAEHLNELSLLENELYGRLQTRFFYLALLCLGVFIVFISIIIVLFLV